MAAVKKIFTQTDVGSEGRSGAAWRAFPCPAEYIRQGEAEDDDGAQAENRADSGQRQSAFGGAV